MKARYLVFYSYIGTFFRSSQKVWLKSGLNYPDIDSVQGIIEIGLQNLKSKIYPEVHLSSRTDGGVHAINTSAHFDIDKPGQKIYETEYITHKLNKFFYDKNISINIRKCLRVSDDFDARFLATSRTYLYRLAVSKSNILPEYVPLAAIKPIEEWKRCHFYRVPNDKEFNIERFIEGSTYLLGRHDFSTFKKNVNLEYKHSRREVSSFTVKPGTSLLTRKTNDNSGNPFDYWDIEISGRAFVHNQIRRMVGALIAVAIGKLEPKDIKVMLQVPSKHSWHSFISSGPPDGLYLCNVEYDPKDLIYNPDK